jgi:hypothetical protein
MHRIAAQAIVVPNGIGTGPLERAFNSKKINSWWT